jgi:hypothetical protein
MARIKISDPELLQERETRTDWPSLEARTPMQRRDVQDLTLETEEAFEAYFRNKKEEYGDIEIAEAKIALLKDPEFKQRNQELDKRVQHDPNNYAELKRKLYKDFTKKYAETINSGYGKEGFEREMRKATDEVTIKSIVLQEEKTRTKRVNISLANKAMTINEQQKYAKHKDLLDKDTDATNKVIMAIDDHLGTLGIDKENTPEIYKYNMQKERHAYNEGVLEKEILNADKKEELDEIKKKLDDKENDYLGQKSILKLQRMYISKSRDIKKRDSDIAIAKTKKPYQTWANSQNIRLVPPGLIHNKNIPRPARNENLKSRYSNLQAYRKAKNPNGYAGSLYPKETGEQAIVKEQLFTGLPEDRIKALNGVLEDMVFVSGYKANEDLWPYGNSYVGRSTSSDLFPMSTKSGKTSGILSDYHYITTFAPIIHDGQDGLARDFIKGRMINNDVFESGVLETLESIAGEHFSKTNIGAYYREGFIKAFRNVYLGMATEGRDEKSVSKVNIDDNLVDSALQKLAPVVDTEDFGDVLSFRVKDENRPGSNHTDFLTEDKFDTYSPRFTAEASSFVSGKEVDELKNEKRKPNFVDLKRIEAVGPGLYTRAIGEKYIAGKDGKPYIWNFSEFIKYHDYYKNKLGEIFNNAESYSRDKGADRLRRELDLKKKFNTALKKGDSSNLSKISEQLMDLKLSEHKNLLFKSTEGGNIPWKELNKLRTLDITSDKQQTINNFLKVYSEIDTTKKLDVDNDFVKYVYKIKKEHTKKLAEDYMKSFKKKQQEKSREVTEKLKKEAGGYLED